MHASHPKDSDLMSGVQSKLCNFLKSAPPPNLSITVIVNKRIQDTGLVGVGQKKILKTEAEHSANPEPQDSTIMWKTEAQEYRINKEVSPWESKDF